MTDSRYLPHRKQHSHSGGGGLSNIVEDLTPQLGGDLDLNGKSFDFPTTPDISDVLDEDNMASDSATMLATQQSIKAYIDAQVATRIANLVEDTTPQLGGDLDLNGKNLDFPTTANISDVLDEDDMASDSATKLATQQSIKAYADADGDADWIGVTHLNSWVDYTGIGYNPAAYRIDGRGRVWIRGLVRSGSAANAVIFTLPVGYRPPYHERHTTPRSGGNAHIQVASDGNVYADAGGSTAWMFLDGICFYI